MATVSGTPSRELPLPERLVRNVVSNSAAAALGAGAQLGAIVVASQGLDTVAYAAFLVAIALVGVAEMASDFGARVWAAQQFALGEPPRRVLGDALVIKAAYSALMAAAVLAVPLAGFTLTTSVLCCLIAITQASSDPMLWYLRGAGRLDAEAGIVLANRGAAAATACLLAWDGWGLDAILAAWLACNLLRIFASAALPTVRPLFKRVPAECHCWLDQQCELGTSIPLLDKPAVAPNVSDPRQARKLSAILAATIPLGASLLMVSLFQRAGVLLMDTAGTPRDVALFGTSYKFVSTASLLATSLALAHFPDLVRYARAGRTADANRVLEVEVRTVVALFAPLCLAGIVVGPLLGESLLGAGLADAGLLLAALMPGLFISSINIGGKFTLNALDRNWLDAAFAAAGLAAFCGAFYAPWPASPCLRAAIGWTAGELLIFVLRREAARRHAAALHVPARLVLGVTGLLAIAAAFQWAWHMPSGGP